MKILTICAVVVISALCSLFALADPTPNANSDLASVNRQIADLEAKLAAIDHIKRYAESVNLTELRNSDVEQAVAHFVKSTRPSFDSASFQKGAMTTEKQSGMAETRDAMSAIVGTPPR